MLWETNTMVRPSSRIRFMMSLTCSSIWGKRPAKGLVQEINLHVQGDGPSYLQQLALAVGQVLGEGVPLVPHSHVFQDGLGPLPVAGTGPFQAGPTRRSAESAPP